MQAYAAQREIPSIELFILTHRRECNAARRDALVSVGNETREEDDDADEARRSGTRTTWRRQREGEETFFLRGLAPLALGPGSTGWAPARAALLPARWVHSQGLGGGSYSFLLSFRARTFFFFYIPRARARALTFLNALLIPSGSLRAPITRERARVCRALRVRV